VIWLLMFLTVPIAMALVAASLLAPIRRGALFYRMTLFLPYVLPSVITAAIWQTLLNPDRGLGAQLTDWGVGGFDRAFLGDPDTVLPAIAFIDNWHWWGFLMVLFLAAMQNVPGGPLRGGPARRRLAAAGVPRRDAARDQADAGLHAPDDEIWSFLTFDYIWILTQGGPAGSSEVLSVLVQKNAFLGSRRATRRPIGVTMSVFVGSR
jgi:raffinose/stachyose/melibiose transport system permease protein